jgi:hypothetical protein
VGYRWFESISLQRRVACEPEFQGRMSRCTQGSETDPVDFRLRHLDDPRARDAITAAAERFRLVAFSAEGRGVGAASLSKSMSKRCRSPPTSTHEPVKASEATRRMSQIPILDTCLGGLLRPLRP